MRFTYRLGDHEYTTSFGTDSLSILGLIGRRFPPAATTILTPGTARYPKQTTRDELVLALQVALNGLDADPDLFFRYSFTTEIDSKPHFRDGNQGCSGLRFADT